MDASPNAAEHALEEMIERLHARGRLRVWSLIVTVFGDAIAPRGGRVALSVLQEIMTRLRIEPGAVRTALSRLAADHWVTREKDGRNSFYRLADEGRHAFDLATRRIYAAGPPAWDGNWTVAIAPQTDVDRAGTGSRLAGYGFAEAGKAWVFPGIGTAVFDDEALKGLLVMSGRPDQVPAGARRFWKLDGLAASYRSVSLELETLAGSLGEGERLAPLDAIAARILVNHHWRRVALRDPGLPAALLPEEWPGEEARDQVRAIYKALASASEAWIDQAGLPPLSDPSGFVGRFGGLDQSSR